MQLTMTLLAIFIILFIAFIIIKPYFEKYDTIIAYTGGLGSGKTFSAVKMCLKLYKRAKLKVWFHNHNPLRVYKKNFKIWEKPILLSNIPIYINKKEGICPLLQDSHLTLQERIPARSVVFIDEIGAYASQFDYNVSASFNEFVRLFRHYTLGGYLVCTEQSSENIVLEVRRRLNQVFNLMHFRKWFGLIYSVKIRNMSVSEEIKTVEENNSEDNMSTKIGLMPLFTKHYDTYCYSGRYDGVPSGNLDHPKMLKRYTLFKISKDKKPAKTIDHPIEIEKKEEKK